MRARPHSLAAVFLRIGNLTFGGGDPAMAALQRELVGRRAWLSQDEYTLVWSLARVTPGTNIVAFCAGSGWLLAGLGGAMIAVIASCLPSAVLTYWLAVAERQWQSHPWVASALRGIAAAVAGMMLAGALMLLEPAWRAGKLARALPVTLAAALASYAGSSPVVVLAVTAAIGWYLGGGRRGEASAT